MPITLDVDKVPANYDSFVQIMPRDMSPTLDGAKNVYEQFAALGTKLSSNRVEDHIDWAPLEAIRKAANISRVSSVTTINAALAAVQGLVEQRARALGVKSLQEYHDRS